MKVAFCGLSHLGVCMSIAAHHWRWDVVCFDLIEARVKEIQSGQFDSAEPGVTQFLNSSPDRFLVTSNLSYVQEADLVFIAIDTELGEHGDNDESEASRLLEAVTAVVDPNTPIVIASQVRPGFTRRHAVIHDSLFYLMETLIFGSGLARAMSPERYVVGTKDPDRELPPALYNFLQAAQCPLYIMSYESAELTKLAANFVLAANVTAANSLAELAEKVGADWGQIESALRADSRIGAGAYISAGLGLGGSNLSRDLFGLKDMAETRGVSAELATVILHHSDYMRSWLIRILLGLLQRQNRNKVALLGLSYKPGTRSTRNSAGMRVLEAFGAKVTVHVHDPSVTLPVAHRGDRVHQVDTALQALNGASVVVVATPYPQYREVLKSFVERKPTVVIVDPYRIVDSRWIQTPETRLVQLGVSID